MTRLLEYVRVISECPVLVVSISVVAIDASFKCDTPTRSTGDCWLGATKLGSSVADFAWDNGQAWTYTSETDPGESKRLSNKPTNNFH